MTGAVATFVITAFHIFYTLRRGTVVAWAYRAPDCGFDFRPFHIRTRIGLEAFRGAHTSTAKAAFYWLNLTAASG